MRTSHLSQNTLSSAAFEWLQAKYRAVDAMDAAAYGQFLAEDCQLMFANNPVATGREQLLQGIRQFWGAINGLDHAFQNLIGSDHFIAAEALIDYTRKDGRLVTLPCVTLIERNEAGLASAVRIFIDTTPIFQ